MFKVEINWEKCIKCKLCVELCPSNAFSFENNSIVADSSKCLGCMGCIPLCPTKAIRIVIVETELF
ncbi:MAG: 4Fe-4S binding protein [Desulfurococcaceae archaeon]|uniref:4Fe-4S dicluster domain-containing protein n=1 Tax=Staphylothermus marinus TaxID=2280 RepID=A0A7C4JLU9_STAMA